MPKTSVRTLTMPSSPIRRLVDFAVEAEKRGMTVHYLNIGQPDVASPDAFWAAVGHTGLSTLEYSHSAGIAALREGAARRYRGKGIDVDASQVMVTTGGSEATLFTFLACFDPGDEVIVIEPFYANYLGFAVETGITLVPITTKLDNDFALPTPAEIESHVSPRTKGILLCNPSNPTGTVFPPDQLREIAALARARDLYLIVDEVYREFYYGKEELLSVLQIPGMEEHAIMLDSVSKMLSLCGARVGFLVTRNPDVLQGALKYGQARLASPTLDQLGVVACFDQTPPSYFEKMRSEYMRRRDVLVDRLRQIPGVRCPRIDGAFYAIVHLPVDNADRFCEWLVRDFSHEGQTVLLAPASGFYMTPGLGRQEVRIAYVLEADRIEAATAVLAAALPAYANAHPPSVPS